MTAILVRLPIRTRNPLNGQMGNSRLAAIIRSRARAEHRDVTRLLVANALRWHDVAPKPPFVVTLTRLSCGRMDDDGLAASMKGVRDGIASALGIDDGDTARLRFRYAQRRGPQRVHQVECLIESATAQCERRANA